MIETIILAATAGSIIGFTAGAVHGAYKFWRSFR